MPRADDPRQSLDQRRPGRRALDPGVGAARPVSLGPLPHRRPPPRVRRQRLEQVGELAQPGGGAAERLQRPLGIRLELERRSHLEREPLGILRQLDRLLVASSQGTERPSEPSESLAYGGGQRRRLVRLGGLVIEFRHARDPVRPIGVEPFQQHEAPLADGDDVGAAVRESPGGVDQGHAAHSARIRGGIGARCALRGHVRDPKPSIGRETVGEEPAIARLEDMQRLRGPGEQDDRQGKDRELTSHR